MGAIAPAVVIPVAVVLLYFLIPGVHSEPWTPLRVSGLVLAVIGYALVITARVQLGRSFSVKPKATELVAHGLYSHIRNPMYVFLDVMLVGVIVMLNVPWVLLAVPVLIVMQSWQARRESKVLEAKFGQAYLGYRRQTWF
jgi:protein-S-isoprenylcysteine O-methyltransferase Ste14